jgi:hypothetical protein
MRRTAAYIASWLGSLPIAVFSSGFGNPAPAGIIRAAILPRHVSGTEQIVHRPPPELAPSCPISRSRFRASRFRMTSRQRDLTSGADPSSASGIGVYPPDSTHDSTVRLCHASTVSSRVSVHAPATRHPDAAATSTSPSAAPAQLGLSRVLLPATSRGSRSGRSGARRRSSPRPGGHPTPRPRRSMRSPAPRR